MASASSLKQARGELVSVVGQTVQDTDAMTATITAMGPPDVSGGQAEHAKLLSAFNRVHDALSTAETKSQQLPVDSPAAFKSEATAMGKDINSELSGIGSTLSDFGPELDAAATADPNCQKLSSQTQS